ncbi:hypothetical protein B0H13DRAFT_1935500 [Mycena leptocephala]|nr:hypothetical protein B0H13DRAFT_1935500 [Mycena leptocephala]
MISTLIIQIFVVLVFMAHGSTRREAKKIGGKLGSGEQSKSRSGSARGVYGTTSNNFLIPSVLLAGTAASELVAAWGKCLPARHSVVLDTENPMLDRVVAACQFANSVSIGFVENILPDSDGSHEDYQWISTVLGPGPDLEEHPHHQQATTVLQSTLKRRREHQGDSSRHCNNLKIQPWVLNSPGIFLWFYHPWIARSHSQGIDISMVVGATEISYMLRNEEDGAWYSPEDAEGIR